MRISVIISYIITKEEKSDSTILGYLSEVAEFDDNGKYEAKKSFKRASRS